MSMYVNSVKLLLTMVGAAAGYYHAHGHITAETTNVILIITSMMMYHELGLGKIRRAVAK